MNRSAVISLALVSAVVVGCKSKPAAPAAHAPAIQPIAVVDIRQIMKAMGWDREMSQVLSAGDRQMRLAFDRQVTELEDQASAVKGKIAAEAHLDAKQIERVRAAAHFQLPQDIPLTEAQRQALDSADVQASEGILQARQSYQTDFAASRTKLDESYRSVVMPIAQRVAEQAGFRIVMADDAMILYHAPETDVSQQVIDELKRGKPSWEPSGK